MHLVLLKNGDSCKCNVRQFCSKPVSVPINGCSVLITVKVLIVQYVQLVYQFFQLVVLRMLHSEFRVGKLTVSTES